MVSDPITVLIVAIIASVAGIFLCVFFLRFPRVLFLLTLGLFVLDVVFGQWALDVHVGSLNIAVMDVLSIFLLTTGGLRLLLAGQRPRNVLVFILVLGLLLCVSWARGVEMFGLQTSTNAVRQYLYFFSTLVFTVTLKPSRKLIYFFAIGLGMTAWIFIAIAIVRWTLVSLGLASSVYWIAAGGWMARVIFAAPTFLLLQMLILTWYTRAQSWKMPLASITPGIFLTAILVLQHRTIWAALLVTLMLILVLEHKVRGMVLIGLLLLAAIAILLLTWGDVTSAKLSGTALDLNNFDFRILSWQALVAPERYRTYLDFFIGQPFGTGYLRAIAGHGDQVTVSPHDFYVETFLNIGGLGLLILLGLYVLVLRDLWWARENPLSRAFITLVTTQLIFYITYSPNYEQGFVLGIVLLFATMKSEQMFARYAPPQWSSHPSLAKRVSEQRDAHPIGA